MAKKKEIVSVESLPDWASGFFYLLWGGAHHWPPVEVWGVNGFRLCVRGDFATWDSNKLTLAVLWAHKIGVRVSLGPHTFNTMELCCWKRKQVPDGEVTIMGCHPTMEQHLARIGESFNRIAATVLDPKPAEGGA